MIRNLSSNYYKELLADEELSYKLKYLSYNDKEFIVWLI